MNFKINASPGEPEDEFISGQHLEFSLMREVEALANLNPQKLGENRCLLFQNAKFGSTLLHINRKLIQNAYQNGQQGRRNMNVND